VPIAGSLEAIALLSASNIDVYVATNQSGIARRKLTLDALEAIHNKMVQEVESKGGKIVDVKFCPHHPDEDCWCRKPNPGLLENLATTHDLSLKEGCYVGDSLKDLKAAAAAGCAGILVLTGNGLETQKFAPYNVPIFRDLLDFAQKITS
jgi:D-glycero-D-manno-heptose 1,7-bisphosphate phosphatase